MKTLILSIALLGIAFMASHQITAAQSAAVTAIKRTITISTAGRQHPGHGRAGCSASLPTKLLRRVTKHGLLFAGRRGHKQHPGGIGQGKVVKYFYSIYGYWQRQIVYISEVRSHIV